MQNRYEVCTLAINNRDSLLTKLDLARNALPKMPVEVMVYAAKHGYPDLAREAAPSLVDKPLKDMVKMLPLSLVLPWVFLFHLLVADSPDCLAAGSLLRRLETSVRCGLQRSLLAWPDRNQPLCSWRTRAVLHANTNDMQCLQRIR